LQKRKRKKKKEEKDELLSVLFVQGRPLIGPYDYLHAKIATSPP
jgi:hypothetical protein